MNPISLIVAGVLADLLKPLVVRVIAMLGLGFITFKGVELFTDQVKSLLLQYLGNNTEIVIGYLGLLQVDKCISLYLSAMAIKATLTFASRIGRTV